MFALVGLESCLVKCVLVLVSLGGVGNGLCL